MIDASLGWVIARTVAAAAALVIVFLAAIGGVVTWRTFRDE